MTRRHRYPLLLLAGASALAIGAAVSLGTAAEPTPAARTVKLELDPTRPADFEVLLARGHFKKSLLGLFKQIAMREAEEIEALMLQATPPGEGRVKAVAAGRKLLLKHKIDPALQKNVRTYIDYHAKRSAPYARPDNVIALSRVSDVDVWELLQRRKLLLIVFVDPRTSPNKALRAAFAKLAAADAKGDRVYLTLPMVGGPGDFVGAAMCMPVMEEKLFPQVELDMPSLAIFRGKQHLENVQIPDAASLTTVVNAYVKGEREKKVLKRQEVF